jgi:hypothetical protein
MSSRKTRAIGRKLYCLNPNSQWCNRIPTATTSERGAVRNRLIDFLNLQPLPDGRWETIPSEGMSRTPTSHSTRSTLTEHEIAYRGRPPRRRSSRSSPRQGKPAAGRRGTGDLIARTERSAKCKKPKQFWDCTLNVADEDGRWRISSVNCSTVPTTCGLTGESTATTGR